LKSSGHNESVDREFIEQLAMADQSPLISPTTPQTPIIVNNNNFNININLTSPAVRSIDETKKGSGIILTSVKRAICSALKTIINRASTSV